MDESTVLDPDPDFVVGEVVHRHIVYQSVSMVSAVACPECGVYVAAEFTGPHNKHHDLLDAIARQGVVVIEGGGGGE